MKENRSLIFISKAKIKTAGISTKAKILDPKTKTGNKILLQGKTSPC